MVAYEPHWAIGAAEPAPDDHISTVCAALRTAVAGLDAHPDSSVIYGGSAGPGLLTRLADTVDGLFLGRFAHDPTALATVLDEADGSPITAWRGLAMTIGISTYAFFWQWHDTAEQPLSLTEMITKTHRWGAELFQICDYPLIESYDQDQLSRTACARRRPRSSAGAGHPGGAT